MSSLLGKKTTGSTTARGKRNSYGRGMPLPAQPPLPRPTLKKLSGEKAAAAPSEGIGAVTNDFQLLSSPLRLFVFCP